MPHNPFEQTKKAFAIREKKVSNKIKTAGYFIKRLKDSGIIVWKIFNAYNAADPRRWTALIDPGVSSVYVTCITNKEAVNDIMFTFDDGGQKFAPGTYLKTESIETVIQYLIDKGVSTDTTLNPFAAL